MPLVTTSAGSAAYAIFAFKKLYLLRQAVNFLKILFNPKLAVRKAASETKQSVLFTLGYEVVTLENKIGLCNKLLALDLQIFKPVKQLLRLMEMKPHDVTILLIIGNKLLQTVDVFLQCIFIQQRKLYALRAFGETALEHFVRDKKLIYTFIGVLMKIPQMICNIHYLYFGSTVDYVLRAVFAVFKHLRNSFRCILPRYFCR